MFSRIDTVFLRVRNLEEALAWYTEQLGLTLRWKQPGLGCLDLGEAPKRGETPLTLIEVTEGFSPSTEAAFNFYAADVEAAYSRLKEAGAVVDDKIEEDSATRWFGFQDPDGNRLEVCSWPES